MSYETDFEIIFPQNYQQAYDFVDLEKLLIVVVIFIVTLTFCLWRIGTLYTQVKHLITYKIVTSSLCVFISTGNIL